MRLFAWEMLRDFSEAGHADAATNLEAWRDTVEASYWTSFSDMRATFPSADRVGERYIFNICGNKYRLICGINFEFKVVYTKWIGTHAEYDKIKAGEI